MAASRSGAVPATMQTFIDGANLSNSLSQLYTMDAGQMIEEAPVKELFAAPAHPYTKGLIASVPKLGSGVKVLPSIPGSVPDLSSLPEGCRFAPRCAFATERCRKEKPDLYPVGEGQRSRCFLAENAGKGEK